jgi:hypothetical protein
MPRLKRLAQLVVTDSIESENEYQRAARRSVRKVPHFFASAQQQFGAGAARAKGRKPDQECEHYHERVASRSPMKRHLDRFYPKATRGFKEDPVRIAA